MSQIVFSKICVVIQEYCDLYPAENTPNSLPPESFTQKLGDVATLTCKTGYEKTGTGQLEAICSPMTLMKGNWSQSVAQCTRN